MYYHAVIMTIFAFIKTPLADSGEAATASVSSANRICNSSAQAVAGLMEIHETHVGTELMNFTNMQWISISLFALIDDLDDAVSHSAFRSLCTPAISLAKRWPLHRGILQLVNISVRQKRKDPPDDIRQVFEDFEKRYWRRED